MNKPIICMWTMIPIEKEAEICGRSSNIHVDSFKFQLSLGSKGMPEIYLYNQGLCLFSYFLTVWKSYCLVWAAEIDKTEQRNLFQEPALESVVAKIQLDFL